MSFNISQIVNTKTQPIPVSGLGSGQIVKSSGEVVSLEEDMLVLDTTKSISLDHLVWSTNRKNGVRLRVMAYSGGSIITVADVMNDGYGIAGFQPFSIVESGSSFFNVIEYDEVNNKFKFSLKQRLDFSEGLRVLVDVISDDGNEEPMQAAVSLLGREYA